MVLKIVDGGMPIGEELDRIILSHIMAAIQLMEGRGISREGVMSMMMDLYFMLQLSNETEAKGTKR